MIFLIGSVLVQVFCIVHVIKTGRNQAWIFAIAFLSMIGCLAYFVAEILPTLGHNRHVRTARAQIVAKVDPERALRAAIDRAGIAETAGNEIGVGDAYAELGRYFDALPHYRKALTLLPGDDPKTQFKLARALFETGESGKALGIIDTLPEERGIGQVDRRRLLRARVLNHLGRNEEAAHIYEDIVTRIAGEEARCRYAALLLETNQRGRARQILEEVETRMKRLDRQQRAPEADMYSWAMKELAGLRAG